MIKTSFQIAILLLFLPGCAYINPENNDAGNIIQEKIIAESSFFKSGAYRTLIIDGLLKMEVSKLDALTKMQKRQKLKFRN